VATDPDLAGLEAAQALAAETIGREMSPDPDDLDRRREQRAREREMERLRDSDVVEIEHVPRASGQTERSEETEHDMSSDGYGEDEDNLTPNALAQLHPVVNQRQEARNQRRLGYFDLHPERRPPSVATQDDDPRSLLSATDSDEEPDVVPIPRNLDIARSLDVPTVRPLPTPTGPAHHSPVSPVDIPHFDDAEDRRREEREHARSKADSVILTPTNGASADRNGHVGAGKIAEPKPAAPSKTSALIDMFREKEQRVSPAAKPAGPSPAPVPSRLPVRTGTIPTVAPAPIKAPQPLPKTPPAPSPTPVALPKSPAPPAPAPAPLLDPAAIEPPRPIIDSGRASPARYVHGAPLHNVLEEEEEET
jgi:hypothetical protein